MKAQASGNCSGLGYRSGGGIKILLFLFFVPILLFAVALFIILVPLPRPFPPAASKGRNLAAALITLFNGMFFIGSICLYSFWRIVRASHGMDPVFRKHGFYLGKAFLFARTLQGEHKGIGIRGELFPDYKFKPWRFTVCADVSPGFNGAIGNRKPVTHLPNAARLNHEGGFSSLYICSDNAGKMQSMLDSAGIREAVGKIQSELSSADTWYIILRPKQIQIEIMPHLISHDSMDAWIEGFYQLLDFFHK